MTDEIININSENIHYNVKKEAVSAFKIKLKVVYDLIQKNYVNPLLKSTVDFSECRQIVYLGPYRDIWDQKKFVTVLGQSKDSHMPQSTTDRFLRISPNCKFSPERPIQVEKTQL